MHSLASSRFWRAFESLTAAEREQAAKAYRLFESDPKHPSLHFKVIWRDRGVWSARASRDLRVLGKKNGDEIEWFWIGRHKDYDRILSSG